MEGAEVRKIPHPVFQNAWVVPNLEAAMRHWLDMGYGPFLTMEVDRPEAIYRGKVVPLNTSNAFTQAGELNIELIQQNSPGPSAYRDMFGPSEGGFHHLCWFCDDVEADKQALVRQGFAVAAEIEIPGLTHCVVDTRPAIGCMIELMPDGPAIRGIYKMVRDAAQGWDGRNPIRPFR